MTTPNDKFKVIETAPLFEIGSTGSYGFDSLKIINILKSRNPLTGSTVITWNLNTPVPPVPPVPPVNPEITILRYNNNPLVSPFDGTSFLWSGVTWTLDNTLPEYSWTSNPTQVVQQEQQNASSLISVVIGTLVTLINQYAFNNCTNLTSITIPTTVITINEYAFNNCSVLTSIIIPNSVNWISNYAFADCISLTSINIPSSVDRINNSVFFRCTSLSSVIIPNTLTTISSNAFRFCSSLTSIIIPSSVISIVNGAFIDSGLTTVTINNNQIYDPNGNQIPSPASNVNFFGRTVQTILP